LVEKTDYTIRVLNRTEIVITLQNGRQWSQVVGPLLVTDINTRGDETGWIKLRGDGVLVANIQDDVVVMTSNQIIYDKSPKLRIRGSNFNADDHNIILELGVSGETLKADMDYLITKDSDDDGLILRLLGNKK
jgi:hypothetical protein